VEISFCDAKTCAVFNSLSALRAKYGVEIAGSIVVRMGVLNAAPVLAAVPRKPPINLTTDEGDYTVSLAQSRRLRFRPDQKASSSLTKPSKVTAIQIIGVEG